MSKQRLILPALILAGAFHLQAEVPIACNLNALSAAQRRELKQFSDRIVNAVVGSREFEDGYGFRVDADKVSVTDLAGGIELWRKCCPFYQFQIDLRGEDGALWLSLRGRKGVKEYFPLDAPALAAKLPARGAR